MAFGLRHRHPVKLYFFLNTDPACGNHKVLLSHYCEGLTGNRLMQVEVDGPVPHFFAETVPGFTLSEHAA